MNQVLEKNIELLKKYQPNLYAKISDYLSGKYKPRNSSVKRIMLARQDDMVINMLVECNGNEYLICDHEDPVNQAYRWIDKYIDPSSRSYIVFGMGLAFHLEVLIESFKDKDVVIIEPNIDLFYNILEVKNLEIIIKNGQVYVDEPIDLILSKLHELFWNTRKGGIQCQPFEVYVEMFHNEWEEIRNKFIKNTESFTVDLATRKRYGELWIYNNIKNSEKLFEASNANGLVGKFKGIPGILVSAGPSLNKNASLLKDIRDNCVIMAAGTAVTALQKFDVKPHFMVGIDATEGEAAMHKEVKNNDIYFLYSNQIAPGSIEAYDGPRFLINFPVDTFTGELMKYAGIKSEMFLSGPSVANTCFDILYKMGCNPIILVGQDLAFTDGAVYAAGISGDIPDGEESFRKSGCLLCKDIHGNDVYSRMDFISMRNWFENYFEKAKDHVEIINATEGGLNINYARNESLKNVIESIKPQVGGINDSIRNIYNENLFNQEIIDKFKCYKNKLLTELKEIEEFSSKQLEMLNLIRKDIYHPLKDKRAFDKIAYSISEFSEKVINSSVYDILLKNILGMEFFLIKREVEIASRELSKYDDVKDLYIKAIDYQNEILNEKICMVKEYLMNG